MGMFDEVVLRCPECGTEVTFQSKAGRCALDKHPGHAVPVEIAKDIEGDTESCPNCGNVVRATCLVPQTVTPMVGV